MMNLQKLIRLQNSYAKFWKKINCRNYSWESSRPIYKISTNGNSNNVFSQKMYQNAAISHLSLKSTLVQPNLDELVDGNVFEKVCEETLQSLTDFFEELVESRELLKTADVAYSDGVLTVNLGDKFGTYVINRQSPNRQIWLSSPMSGPKRYDFLVKDKYWIYKHDMVPLHKLLQNEISNALGENIDFSKCIYSRI